VATKFVTVLVYLLFGLLVMASPFVARLLRDDLAGSPQRTTAYPRLAVLLLAADTVWLAGNNALGNLALAITWVSVGAITGLLVRRDGISTAIGVASGLALASSMPWWRHALPFIDASVGEIASYAAISLIAIAMLAGQLLAPTTARIRVRWKAVTLLAFIPVVLFLSFGTGISVSYQPWLAGWHHWSAFVGPAELLTSGAHIFSDFPAQYGFGPTVLIAAACKIGDCWIGMYYIVGCASVLMTLMVLCTALTFSIRSHLAMAILPVLTIAACFFWTSYGPALSSSIIYPSILALRFTPVVALVTALSLCEVDPRWARRWKWLGHGLWAVGALWSPESLYAVSFVWWPYYCWRQSVGQTWRRLPVALLRAIGELVLVLLAVLAGFVFIYWLAYRDVPNPTIWFAYILYPPGAIPLNGSGPIWWYIAVLVLGIAALFRAYRDAGDSATFRRTFLVVLMAYATLSYCMGRSHDNNFVNLLPYAMLVLVGSFASSMPLLFRAASAAMLASIIGWMPVFGWGSWQEVYASGQLFAFAPERLAATFSYLNPDTRARINVALTADTNPVAKIDDAARAILSIKQRSGEPVTIIDTVFVVQNGPPEIWDAFSAPEDYVFLPEQLRTQFAVAVARRLRRTGWVIIAKEVDQSFWLTSYSAAYDLASVEDFGSYRAYHFVPKAGGQ
jgi:hypothetical protein